MRLLKLFLLLPVLIIGLILVLGYFDSDCNFKVGRTIETVCPGERATANYWYERAAKKGHTSSLSYSGMYFLFGYGEQDKQKGIQFLEKAAKEKDTYAMACLAAAYEWGLGVEQNYAKARDLTEDLLKIYKEEHVKGERREKAQARLAYIYTIAPPPVRDFEKAYSLLNELLDEKAQEDNPAESIGLFYYYGLTGKRDIKKSVKYIESGAKLGGKKARECLGMFYLTGQGKKQDYSKANKWLNYSASQGNIISQLILAVAYGTGIPHISENKDNQKWSTVLKERGFNSFEYFHKNKEKGIPSSIAQIKEDAKTDKNAATILGVIYDYGIGVKEDSSQAVKYLELARTMGSYDANVIMAEDIFQYPCEMKLLEKANSLLEEAYKNKHRAGTVLYALNLSGGVTCKQNWNKCYSILSSLNLDNEPDSEFMIAQCLVYGLGTERDAKKGLKLIEKLSLAGNTEAAIYLLDNYSTFDNKDKIEVNKQKIYLACQKYEVPELLYGESLIEKDKTKSKKLLMEAAKLGFEKAKTEIINSELVGGDPESEEYLKKLKKSGLADTGLLSSEKQVERFRNNFVRDADSKKVLRALKDLKQGDVFTKDSFEKVDVEFVLGTYLDDNPDTLKFLVGKSCLSDIAKGSEISIYDVGPTGED